LAIHRQSGTENFKRQTVDIHLRQTTIERVVLCPIEAAKIQRRASTGNSTPETAGYRSFFMEN
jgi:hypothetical protein